MLQNEDHHGDDTMKLVDIHCHLQDKRLAGDMDGVVERAKAADVRAMICCGVNESDWPRVMDAARRFSLVIPSVGLHPWHVERRSAAWFDELQAILAQHPEVGVGEIGLDHASPAGTHDDQLAVFKRQMELAARLSRPVSIHCRQAWQGLTEGMDALKALPDGFVIHSYSGPVEMIRPLADRGAYFSFSGSVTLHRNHRGHAAVAAVPADRLLVETDAPDIPPIIDGKRLEDRPNEPANLRVVLHKVAELRDENVTALAQGIWENAARLYTLPES